MASLNDVIKRNFRQFAAMSLKARLLRQKESFRPFWVVVLDCHLRSRLAILVLKR